MILWFPDFNGCKPFTRKVNVSSSNHEDVSTFRTFFFFFFLIYDCILHKCCAISNQYHFTNPMSTFLPKFQGGSGPPVPPLDPPMPSFLFFLWTVMLDISPKQQCQMCQCTIVLYSVIGLTAVWKHYWKRRQGSFSSFSTMHSILSKEILHRLSPIWNCVGLLSIGHD